MTSIRSILRGAIRRTLPPGEALERTNDLLVPEMLPNMFVTCHYAILEPDSGHYLFANAGHSLPFCKRSGDIEELHARGFPLGIMPATNYQAHETVIQPGECILLFSDGLIEAHNPQGEIYGTHRLKAFLENLVLDDSSFIPALLADLHAFTGPDWVQEDDLTVLCLSRCVTDHLKS
jgi:serine phosphatase RsbU (regulator of sigma subunit)